MKSKLTILGIAPVLLISAIMLSNLHVEAKRIGPVDNESFFSTPISEAIVPARITGKVPETENETEEITEEEIGNQLLLPPARARKMFYAWESKASEILWAATKATSKNASSLIRVIPGADSVEWEIFVEDYLEEVEQESGAMKNSEWKQAFEQHERLLRKLLPVDEKTHVMSVISAWGEEQKESLTISRGASREDVIIDPATSEVTIHGTEGAVFASWDEEHHRKRYGHLFQVTGLPGAD
ncbi:MAG: hypothetical protein AAGJ79_02330 [Verrucomicrobiota bacterium]